MGFETFENPFPFPQVTVILGKNDTCKTALLKMIYSVGKSTELYVKQTMHHQAASFKNIISKKLFDVYAPKRTGLSDIVRKNGTPKKLSVELGFDGEISNVDFSFGMDTRNTITDVNIVNGGSEEIANYIFIPAKEVITAFNTIKAMARQFFFPGYDDTTLDLIDLLDIPVVQGGTDEFQDILRKMSEMFSGELKQVENTERFVFKKGNTEFALPLTAEGVKHIGILSTLIQNGQLNKKSVLILDEPEDNLHPGAIRSLMKIISELGKKGVQVFVTTHSYFVLKQLHIEARSNEMDIMCCSLNRNDRGTIDASFSNLKENLPDNSIIDESMAMYDEDIDLDLKM